MPFIYIDACVCVYIFIYIYTQYIYIGMYTVVFVCVCLRVCVRVRVYVCMCVCHTNSKSHSMRANSGVGVNAGGCVSHTYILGLDIMWYRLNHRSLLQNIVTFIGLFCTSATLICANSSRVQANTE